MDGIFLSDFEQREIGPDLFRHACLMGLEGMVSKHRRAPIAPAGSIAGSRSNIGRIQRSPVCGISSRSARNVPIASRANAFGYVISIDRAIICSMMIRKGDELYCPNGDMFRTKQLESDFESLPQTTFVLRLGPVPGCGSFLTRSLASELAGPRTCRFRYV